MLIGSAAQGNDARIKQLVNAGADANIQANFDEWMSPLIWAARCGNDKSVTLLIASGANPNSAGQFASGGSGLIKSSTPLIWAASFGYADVVRTLLQAGANPNVVEESFLISDGKFQPAGNGRAALTASADEKTPELLLTSGAAPNITDGHGDSPLILAAARGDLDLCLLLLKSGANASLRNKDGMSAADLAEKTGFRRVVAAIREAAR
ncbi:MAG: hypothetical protein F8N15_00865 [Methanobacterium sp.]|nr:hypothetical protein [Methanobacterium sp.]